jgi:diguanylate cyclase (GGDEF)-like protein/PAS domain S-box-containing protein
MILAALAGVAGIVIAVAAAAANWRASTGRETRAKNAYRWLALTALLWGASFVVVEGTPGDAAGGSLTSADLLTLLALIAAGTGMAGLAGVGWRPAGGAERPAGSAERTAGDALGVAREQARSAVARVADASLLTCALFVIGWVALLAVDYHRVPGETAGTFTVQAIQPIMGMITLGVLLAVAVRAGRRGLEPYLALFLVTAGQALALGDQIAGLRPGPVAQVVQLAGIALLGTAGLGVAERVVPPLQRRPPWPDRRSGATLAAALAGGAAALVMIGWALSGGSFAEPAVVVSAGIGGLALAARVTDLLRQERASAAISKESEHRFRQLASRTSDAVLICDREGIIRFASPAVADYGYTPADLDGTLLADLVHPDDREAWARIARAASGGRQPDKFSCRVRSADGTWRHIESSMSRYGGGPGASRLLITARDVSDQVALRRQLTYLTRSDGLTGLPNRAFLEDRVKRAADSAAAQAGAVFISLDGITEVNDSAGHGAGDLLLAQAARRLRGAIPPDDTVARWGSEEFAVLIESEANVQEIVDLAERLAGILAAEPFQVADRDISLSASVGVALAGGAPQDLLRNADAAMTRARESGSGRVEVFAAHMHADAVRRIEIASDLRAAISAGQLELAYQPVADLATSRITGAEALVRWSRAGQPVSPAEFLEVAEDYGLIVPLGEWVLNEACAQAAAWLASGLDAGVFVNVSLRQVTAARFTESVLAALDGAGLPPGVLTLEVAERVLIEGGDQVADRLAELRRHGVRLAIDNFGTGYASLAYLRQLAVDVIKIDPSFVAGLGEDATLAMLTRTIIQVAHDLGIDVVAEGVERREQLEFLRGMGCELGQGYLICEPVPAERVTAAAKSGLASAGLQGGTPAPAEPAPA